MIINAECRAGMADLPSGAASAIVTDPPYGLSKQPDIKEVLGHWLAGDDYSPGCGGFMGKKWDSFVPGPLVWSEAYRVLKPGGYLLAFAGSRTVDLMAMSLRIAGFEVVDMLHWLYGTGFPKSMDISKQLDRAAGVERKVVGSVTKSRAVSGGRSALPTLGAEHALQTWDITEACSDEAKQWEGWGTALKPCHEPIIMARKPLDGTYANNIMTHGVGALNIDGCRVGSEEMARTKSNGVKISENGSMTGGNYGRVAAEPAHGRWPGNVLHDGCLPEPMDRYFYSAKATRADRDAGLGAMAAQTGGQATGRKEGTAGLDSPRSGAGRNGGSKNIHPTVKPTDLMRWMCRLVTPPGGLVLDPFVGSGSTGRGAALEGLHFVGFELDPDYAQIAEARVADAAGGKMPDNIYLTTYADDDNKTPTGPSVLVGHGALISAEPMLGGATLRRMYSAMRIYEVAPGMLCALSRVPFA